MNEALKRGFGGFERWDRYKSGSMPSRATTRGAGGDGLKFELNRAVQAAFAQGPDNFWESRLMAVKLSRLESGLSGKLMAVN
jgi:hypothetical protein